jgi:hypothetical protein
MTIRVVSITLVGTIACLIMAPGLYAQCPQGTDPLQLLVGTWTFSTNGFSPAIQPFASSGQFTASISTRAGNRIGLLSITSTASLNGQIVRQEIDAGTYQIFADCSGGTLTFNLSSRPLAFDFWFANGGTEISFVSITSGGTIHGTAKLGTGGGSFTGAITDTVLSIQLDSAFRSLFCARALAIGQTFGPTGTAQPLPDICSSQGKPVFVIICTTPSGSATSNCTGQTLKDCQALASQCIGAGGSSSSGGCWATGCPRNINVP